MTLRLLKPNTKQLHIHGLGLSVVFFLLAPVFAGQTRQKSPGEEKVASSTSSIGTEQFTDVTTVWGINFEYFASHT